jgi:hypothetical protein
VAHWAPTLVTLFRSHGTLLRSLDTQNNEDCWTVQSRHLWGRWSDEKSDSSNVTVTFGRFLMDETYGTITSQEFGHGRKLKYASPAVLRPWLSHWVSGTHDRSCNTWTAHRV